MKNTKEKKVSKKETLLKSPYTWEQTIKEVNPTHKKAVKEFSSFFDDTLHKHHPFD